MSVLSRFTRCRSAAGLASATLVALLGLLALTGCGGSNAPAGSSAAARSPPSSTPARTVVTSSTIPPGQRVRGDGDADNPGDLDGNGDVDTTDTDSDYPTRASYRFPDSDDASTFAWGRPPSAAQRASIVSVVTRYYADAARAAGGAGCRLLSPSLASSAVAAYAQGGPSYLNGASDCVSLLKLLFAHQREELAAPISIFKVGVLGPLAQVVLSSPTLRASSIRLAREGSSWRLQALIGQPLP